jgi:chromosome partitioning protein
MKTLSVLSRKGGAGKTTVAVSLAVAAQQAGLKTVLADVDPLRSASVTLAGRSDANSLLLETSCTKLAAVQNACRRQRCDLLIIDTPPAPDLDVLRAVEISDLCLAVARPSSLDIAAIPETVRLISKRRRSGLIVLNQCPPRRGGVEATLTEVALQALQFAGLPVASTKLRSRIAYQYAFGQKTGVTEWAPASDAASDILRLLAEVSEQLFRLGPWKREAQSISVMPVHGATVLAPGAGAVHELSSSLGRVGLSLGEVWGAFGV